MRNLNTIMLVLGLLAWSGVAVLAAADNSQDQHHAGQKPLPSSAVKNVAVPEFEKLRSDKNHVVLDVRTPKEFAAGHLPGTININFSAPDFEKKIAALDKNKTYLIHCRSGGRSAKACAAMSKLDFKQVFNLEGGMIAWEKAGHTAEK